MEIDLAQEPGTGGRPPRRRSRRYARRRARRRWNAARIAVMTVGGAVIMALTLLPLVLPVGWLFAPEFRPYFAPGTRLYVDPTNSAAEWVRGHPMDRRAPVIRERIADRPQAMWFTDPNPAGIRAQVAEAVADAARKRAVPVLVTYTLPNRGCAVDKAHGSSGSGDASDGRAIADYRRWINEFAAGIGGGTRAVVILEPDALALDCHNARLRSAHYALMSFAARTLHHRDSRARIYYDAGNSAWQPAQTMADRLSAAGIDRYGSGIALNVSNFNRTHDEVGYGLSVLDRLPDTRLAMVIDTSRNGNGPAHIRRGPCDPPGRRVGTPPRTAPGPNRVDAYLWIKQPGEADGCAANAGVFLPDRAYRLAR